MRDINLYNKSIGHIQMDTPYPQYNLSAKSRMINIVRKLLILFLLIDFRHTIKKGRLMTSYLSMCLLIYKTRTKHCNFLTDVIIPNIEKYFKG